MLTEEQLHLGAILEPSGVERLFFASIARAPLIPIRLFDRFLIFNERWAVLGFLQPRATLSNQSPFFCGELLDSGSLA